MSSVFSSFSFHFVLLFSYHYELMSILFYSFILGKISQIHRSRENSVMGLLSLPAVLSDCRPLSLLDEISYGL